MEPLNATVYLAAEGFEAQLLGELRERGGITRVHGRLVAAEGPARPACWAQNVWLRPFQLRVRSIKDAARQLRAIQRNWASYSFTLHRRAELIQKELPHVSARPLEFPSPPPAAPLGSWTLVERDTILASAECTSPFPHGEARFKELKTGPPTRAYLKLWEALTLLGRRPGPGDRCLDAGASPGGWTWALARLGARVLAVDRAALDPAVRAMPGVEYRKGSAFSILPPRGGSAGIGPLDPGAFDWIFSDVVCYPERLLGWIGAWVSSGACESFVCTIKFQGTSHYGVIPHLARIPGSRLLHLSHNKHELTWMRAGKLARP